MHRALLIEEILRNVCDVADELTLSCLARCCKITHGPATQVLWRVVPDLVPLIKCFPADVWTIEGRKIKFTRIPWPEQWSVFLRNARLVRRLAYTDYNRRQVCDLHENVLETLSSIRPVLVLFPDVRVLKWCGYDVNDRSLPSILSMVGDLVTTVNISGPVPEHILCASIAMITPRLRHLRSIYLDSPFGPGICADTSPVISALLCSLTSLTAFGSYHIPLTLNAIKSLAESKTICHLDVRLPYRADWSSIRFPPQSFILLTELSLSFITEAYIAFSKAVALPQLESLILSVKTHLEPELISELFISIRRQCSPASLQSLIICQLLDGTDDLVPYPYDVLVRGADLQPLWDFTRMEQFQLFIDCNYAFDDAFLLDLANAWPQLERLELPMDGSSIEHGLPSLAGLLPIIAGCPNLEYLRLQFDATGDVTKELHDRAMATPSGVMFLDVGDSPMTHPRSVALFLALAFPEVTEILVGESDDRVEDRVRWEEVQLYLPMLRSVREQERLRIEQEVGAETAAFQS